MSRSLSGSSASPATRVAGPGMLTPKRKDHLTLDAVRATAFDSPYASPAYKHLTKDGKRVDKLEILVEQLLATIGGLQEQVVTLEGSHEQVVTLQEQKHADVLAKVSTLESSHEQVVNLHEQKHADVLAKVSTLESGHAERLAEAAAKLVHIKLVPPAGAPDSAHQVGDPGKFAEIEQHAARQMEMLQNLEQIMEDELTARSLAEAKVAEDAARAHSRRVEQAVRRAAAKMWRRSAGTAFESWAGLTGAAREERRQESTARQEATTVAITAEMGKLLESHRENLTVTAEMARLLESHRENDRLEVATLLASHREELASHQQDMDGKFAELGGKWPATAPHGFALLGILPRCPPI